MPRTAGVTEDNRSVGTVSPLRCLIESVGWGVACVDVACFLAALGFVIPEGQAIVSLPNCLRGLLAVLTWSALALALPAVLWTCVRRSGAGNGPGMWLVRVALGIALPALLLGAIFVWWVHVGPNAIMLWRVPWAATLVAWCCFGCGVLPRLIPIRGSFADPLGRFTWHLVPRGIAGMAVSGGLFYLAQLAARPEVPSAPDALDLVGWLLIYEALLIAGVGCSIIRAAGQSALPDAQ